VVSRLSDQASLRSRLRRRRRRSRCARSGRLRSRRPRLCRRRPWHHVNARVSLVVVRWRRADSALAGLVTQGFMRLAPQRDGPDAWLRRTRCMLPSRFERRQRVYLRAARGGRSVTACAWGGGSSDGPPRIVGQSAVAACEPRAGGAGGIAWGAHTGRVSGLPKSSGSVAHGEAAIND